MTININDENGKITVVLEGRLDSVTAPELEAKLDEALKDAKELIFDFNKLEYISSAGLRILLKSQNTMNTKGKMVITGANEIVMGVFDMTGFSDILNIE